MRKNRSFKEQSFTRNRGSRGKEISIELEKSKPSSTRLDGPLRNPTDRLNVSGWQQNPSISQNILRQIISYGNLSQSGRAPKASTVAVFDKSNDGVLGQLAKIKKASLGQFLPHKEAKRLTLDFPEDKQNRTGECVQLSKSIALSSNLPNDKQQNQVIINCRSFELNSNDLEERLKIQEEKQKLSSKLQQLTIQEELIQSEHSDMVPQWIHMISYENNIKKGQWRLSQLQKSISQHRLSLNEACTALLNNSRDLVASRREWEAKGNGVRAQLLEQAQLAHSEFLRKLTIKDFQETVLFNIKVAIPDYRGNISISKIYQELFLSRSARKFTMILKKHASHMDLYDGRLLADFTKRINDLQTLFNKIETDGNHPDHDFLSAIELAVSQIDQLRAIIFVEDQQFEKQKIWLKSQQQQNKKCEESIHKLIDEMNSQVRGQYSRETEKEADFKSLLLAKVATVYREFRTIQEKRQTISLQLRRLQQKLTQLPQNHF